MSRSDPSGGSLPSYRKAWWAVALPLVLASCTEGVLDPKGPVGAAQLTILIDSLAIMLAIVVPTIAATFAFAWWFRAGNKRARYRPDWEFSGQLEVLVWSIPLMTIMLLGGVAWIGSHSLDPARELPSDGPPLEVQVASLDWKWLFIYPDRQVAAVNELVIPAGVPVRFTLTSASVMNAFFIPELGSMLYAMNGMASELNLQADAPGTFQGRSTHYSGAGFSDMTFSVRAVSADEFAVWLDRTAANSGPTLDATSYAQLAQQSSDVAPFTYRAVDPGLFHRIVMQELPPGPGPTVETNPGAASRAGS